VVVREYRIALASQVLLKQWRRLFNPLHKHKLSATPARNAQRLRAVDNIAELEALTPGMYVMSKLSIAWLFAATGLIVGVFAVALTRRFSNQRKWAKIQGVITVSAVEFLWETYRANIQYRYVIDDKEYVGKTVRSWMLQYNWRGPAARLCSRYPQGSRVEVFVCSTDKGHSVLEPGGDGPTLWLFGLLSVVLILLSVLLSL
jgi:hypothetical protein